MDAIRSIVPFATAALSALFAAHVLARFARRRGPALLLWGIGLVLYGLGGLAEGLNAVGGWNPAVFRLWYLCGAVLVAAWLGQGTVYLWLPRRAAHALMAVLAAASVYAAVRVLGATLDPAAMGGAEMSGKAITSGGVRVLTPFFNSYGTLALVGGALWSVVQLARKKVQAGRVAGNALIAVGALLPALGGTASRLGAAGWLYPMELLGVVVLFAGYLLSSAPVKEKA